MNRNWWGKWTEMLWPWAVATAAATTGLILSQRINLEDEVSRRLLDKVVDVCAINVAFWATALALLLALESRETVAGLRKLAIYNRIVDYFLSTVYAFFALLLLSMITMAIGRPAWFPRNLYVATWTFASTFSVTAMLRSFWLLGKLLKAN